MLEVKNLFKKQISINPFITSLRLTIHEQFIGKKNKAELRAKLTQNNFDLIIYPYCDKKNK